MKAIPAPDRQRQPQLYRQWPQPIFGSRHVVVHHNNANLITDGTWTYTYDIENRLVKAVTGSTTTNLTYDPADPFLLNERL